MVTIITMTKVIINISTILIKSCKKINSSIIGELASCSPNWPQVIIIYNSWIARTHLLRTCFARGAEAGLSSPALEPSSTFWESQDSTNLPPRRRCRKRHSKDLWDLSEAFVYGAGHLTHLIQVPQKVLVCLRFRPPARFLFICPCCH